MRPVTVSEVFSVAADPSLEPSDRIVLILLLAGVAAGEPSCGVMSDETLSAVTGLAADAVRESLDRLSGLGVISMTPDPAAPAGRQIAPSRRYAGEEGGESCLLS